VELEHAEAFLVSEGENRVRSSLLEAFTGDAHGRRCLSNCGVKTAELPINERREEHR